MSTHSMNDIGHEVDPTGWSPTEVELDAEKNVLGAMMTPLSGSSGPLNSPAVTEVRRMLEPNQLFRPAHQAIMQAICTLEERGVTGIDPLIVSDELERQGNLNRVGGGVYLLNLVEMVTTVESATYHAHIVLSAFKRRSALELARTVQQAAATREVDDLDETVETAHQKYLAASSGQMGELRSVGESSWLISSILDEWGHQSSGSMTTGLTDVDRVLDVDRGGLVTIGARSGVGKSILSAQIARHYAFDRGEPALFFALEMTRREMYQRDIAAMARIHYETVSGKRPLSEWEAKKLQQAADRYESEGGMLFHDDSNHLTLAHVRSRMAQIRRQLGGIGIVVVDHLGLATLPRADREDQAIGEFAKNLKQFAGEFNCIIVLAAQLNRSPQSRTEGRPMASDIRGSDQVQHHSDVVALIHDVAKYTAGESGNVADSPRAGELDIILDKQRKGASHGVISVSDRRSFAEFGSLSGDIA